MKLPKYITDLVSIDSAVQIESHEGFIQLDSGFRQQGVIRFVEPFGVFQPDQIVDNLTFDFAHGEMIVYDDACERSIVQPFRITI